MYTVSLFIIKIYMYIVFANEIFVFVCTCIMLGNVVYCVGCFLHHSSTMESKMYFIHVSSSICYHKFFFYIKPLYYFIFWFDEVISWIYEAWNCTCTKIIQVCLCHSKATFMKLHIAHILIYCYSIVGDSVVKSEQFYYWLSNWIGSSQSCIF